MNIYPTNDWTIAKRLVVTEAEIGLVLLFETKTGSHKYTKPQKFIPEANYQVSECENYQKYIHKSLVPKCVHQPSII